MTYGEIMDSFICGICHLEFNDLESFSVHKKNFGSYSCEICDTLFHSESELQQHKDDVHITANTAVLPDEADQCVPSVTDPVAAGAAQDVSSSIEMINIADTSQLPVSVLPGGQLGNVTFLSCSDENIQLLSNIKVLSPEFCNPALVTITTLPTETRDKILSLNSDVKEKAGISSCDFLEVPNESEILEPQSSLLQDSLACDKDSSSQNDISVNSESGLTLPSGEDTSQVSGIYACILCQSFAFTKCDIISHLNISHKESVSANNVDPDQFVTKLEPLPSIQVPTVSCGTGNERPGVQPDDSPAKTELKESNIVNSSSRPTNSSSEVHGPKRRRGRPRKIDQERRNADVPDLSAKNLAPPKVKPQPVLGSDNMYHCQHCKRSFRKDSQILRHKCMGDGDYIALSIKEGSVPSSISSSNHIDEIASDEEVTDLDTDVTKDFKMYSSAGPSENGRKRRKYQQKSEVKSRSSALEENFGNSMQITNKVSSTGRAITVFVRAVENTPYNASNEEDSINVKKDNEENVHLSSHAKPKMNWRKDPDHVPVFSKEEDRLEFEARLNSVNLDCVDHLFTRHEVPQNTDHAQSKNAVGRDSGELSLFLCKVCKKIFKSLSHISLHCLIHTNLKPFTCPQCPYRTNAKGNLYTHMRKHTGNFFHCAHCNFQCCSRSHLLEHEATHSNIRHKCKLCENDYNTVKSLMNHVRKYHGNPEGKKYLSTFLSKGTKNAAVLHVCHICKHTFKKQIDRDRHLFVHKVNDNPNVFYCSLCDYTASRKVYLEAHHKKHRIVYVCCVCFAMFLSSIKLKQHLSDHLSVPIMKEGEEVSTSVPSESNSATASFTPNSTDVNVQISAQVSGEEGVLVSKDLSFRESSSMQLNHGEYSGDKLPLVQHENDLRVDASHSCDAVLGDDSNGSNDINNTHFLTAVGNFEKSKDVCSIDVDFLQQNSNFSDEGLQLNQRTDIKNIESQCGNEEKSSLQENNLDTLFLSSINQSWYLPEPDGTLSFSQYLNISEDLVKGAANASETNTQNEKKNAVSEATKEINLANHDQEQPSRPSALDIIDALSYKPLTADVYEKIRKSFGELECDSCGRLFHGRLDLESHKLSHLEEKPFKCDKCSYSATTKEKLKGHQESVHEGRVFPCNRCDFAAHSRTSLWHHQQKHYGNPTCEICNKQFASARNLREHVISIHPNIGQEQLSKLLGSNRRPIGRLGRRSYKCPYCSRIFHRSSADLQKHIWMHEGIKPYKCDVCSYSCRSSNNLKAHKLTHTNEKPYQCIGCAKSFKSRSALKCHKKAHKQNDLFSSHGNNKTSSALDKNVIEDPSSVFDYATYPLSSDDQNIFQAESHDKVDSNDAAASMFNLSDKEISGQMYKCLVCSCLFKTMQETKQHLQVQHGMLLVAIKPVEKSNELVAENHSVVPSVSKDDTCTVTTADSSASGIQEPMNENMDISHLSPVTSSTSSESISLPNVNVIQKTLNQTCVISSDMGAPRTDLDKGLSLTSDTFDVH